MPFFIEIRKKYCAFVEHPHFRCCAPVSFADGGKIERLRFRRGKNVQKRFERRHRIAGIFDKTRNVFYSLCSHLGGKRLYRNIYAGFIVKVGVSRADRVNCRRNIAYPVKRKRNIVILGKNALKSRVLIRNGLQ